MSSRNKIVDVRALRKLRQKLNRKKIVLCHGVFDLLHVGHINYFKSAKKLGDILVVSITDDKFVNKGPVLSVSRDHHIFFLKVRKGFQYFISDIVG